MDGQEVDHTHTHSLTHPMKRTPLTRPMCSQILVHDQFAGFSGSESESQSTMKSSGPRCFSDFSSNRRGSDVDGDQSPPSDCDRHRASRARCDAALAARISRHSVPQSALSSSRLKDRSTKVVKRLRLLTDSPSVEMLDHRARGGNRGGALGDAGVLDEFLFIVVEEAELRLDLICSDDNCCRGTGSNEEVMASLSLPPRVLFKRW